MEIAKMTAAGVTEVHGVMTQICEELEELVFDDTTLQQANRFRHAQHLVEIACQLVAENLREFEREVTETQKKKAGKKKALHVKQG